MYVQMSRWNDCLDVVCCSTEIRLTKTLMFPISFLVLYQATLIARVVG